jgi:hypothetical protein
MARAVRELSEVTRGMPHGYALCSPRWTRPPDLAT